MVVGAVILTCEHTDADNPIVCHRIVLDADVEGVPVCPTKATVDVNAKEGVAGDSVAGDGGVAEDIVIAKGEDIDPEAAIPSDLVVGDGGVVDLGVGPGSQTGWPGRGCHGGRCSSPRSG